MTYTCPFCHQKMTHYPQNQRETMDETLSVKVGDTFKCGCSINQIDSNGDVWLLNSWILKKDGWYHLGSTDGSVIKEKFAFPRPKEHDWTKICKLTSEPIDTLHEVVEFT